MIYVAHTCACVAFPLASAARKRTLSGQDRGRNNEPVSRAHLRPASALIQYVTLNELSNHSAP